MASTSTTQASSGPETQEHDKAQKEDNSNPKIDVEKQSGAVSFEPDTEPPFSIFSDTKKKLIVLTISFIGLLSPLSANIYFPAITAIAKDLDVSNSDINLTVTTYLIFQAIGPTFFGNLADVKGRRLAYVICLTISIVANIALACQRNYAALLVLRCVQSSGSAATVALGQAVVADVSTRAERGKWVAYASMGIMLGPAIGPLVGGLLDTYMGWPAIFWFLAIFAGVMLMVTLTYLPETCRTVVGNGSVPPQKWNRTLWSFLRKKEVGEQTETLQRAKKRPNPFSSILIILKKEDGLILLYGAFLYAGFYVVLITLTDQLADRYGFNTLQIGLCYIPFGVGCMASRFSVGIFLDRNYKRLAQRLDPSISQNTTQDPENFPIEKARLQIGIPAAYASALSIIIYGWVMHFHTSLAGPLIMLFLIGNFTTGAFNVFSTLIVDINLHQPATASAANNLARCGMGAVFTAFAQPLVGAIGIGWTSTAVAGLWVVLSPCLWAVMVWGPKWRAEEKREMEEKQEKK
ncbi:MFS general substrate transporter [Aureobasidium pullulans]|uniref:MFS general substrate transporter n=1 Tax=Aureobasidium pullulans TaxID=5580 RepID=A0A4S8SS32_AURPU|nr:MFS general substrate transporter [Aureobasidium pullulans]THZ00718.1 MFS general substrate transporter [Aureobasidium pullulans]TIA21700.1 MFS general substrate transporter [Aureobasidium pullulans]